MPNPVEGLLEVYEDYKLIKYLLESPMQNRKVQIWVLSISGYNCKIEYIEGTPNSVADLLSRSHQGHPVT